MLGLILLYNIGEAPEALNEEMDVPCLAQFLIPSNHSGNQGLSSMASFAGLLVC
jgi:hypothetical protein